MTLSVSDSVFNLPLIFVTGKGGTGKSLISGVVGVNLAKQGKKVLLIDSESTGSLAEQFEHSHVKYEPVEVTNNVYISQIDTDDALAEYLNLNAKIPTWAKITPLARFIDLVSHAAPGVKEILVVGKICYEVKQILEGSSQYDVVVVDAPSSGHIISLIDAPRALSEIVKKGMIQEQTQWMQDILHDDRTTGVLVITTTDDVVLLETNELVQNIEEQTEVQIAGIVINKDLADIAHDHEFNKIAKSKINVLNRARQFYLEKIEKTHKVVEQLNRYPLYAFPMLNESEITLRSISKNSEKLIEISKGKQ